MLSIKCEKRDWDNANFYLHSSLSYEKMLSLTRRAGIAQLARAPAFQAGCTGSSPVTRSISKSQDKILSFLNSGERFTRTRIGSCRDIDSPNEQGVKRRGELR